MVKLSQLRVNSPELHRLLTKTYNFLLIPVPNRLKYGLGVLYRRGKHPYKLLSEGDTVLIVGSASDILRAGRSRTITMALIVGPTGHVIVLEPDEGNFQALREYVNEHGLSNITLIKKGAWRERATLSFLSSPKHPAASRVKGVIPNDLDVDEGEVVETTIDVDTIDSILEDLDEKEPIKLVSITVNGAEYAVLEGMTRTIHQCHNLSVARAWKKNNVLRFLDERGYSPVAKDDRGVTFSKKH